jgi:hypothetical protein
MCSTLISDLHQVRGKDLPWMASSYLFPHPSGELRPGPTREFVRVEDVLCHAHISGERATVNSLELSERDLESADEYPDFLRLSAFGPGLKSGWHWFDLGLVARVVSVASLYLKYNL